MVEPISPKQRSALERAIKHPELQLFLFRKADGLSWFDAFQESGFLAPNLVPPPKEVEEGQFQIPNWSVTEYLVGCSKYFEGGENLPYAEKLWVLIKEVTDYAKENGFGNYRVWWQFSKIIRNLPLELIKGEYSEVVQYWLSDKFGADLVGDELIGWLIELLESSDQQALDIAHILMGFIYAIEFVDKKYSEDGRQEAALTFRSYHYRDKGEAIATKAGEVLGLPFLEFIQSRMEEILEIENNDKWSCMWRPAIENHTQNHNHRGEEANHVVLVAFRDALAGYLKKSSQDVLNETIDNLLDNNYQTIRRLAIHTATEQFDELSEDTVDKLLNPEYFHDNYRHEIWHFLNKNFGNFSGEQKNHTIEVIQSLKGRHDEDEEIYKARTAYYQSLWLTAIKDIDATANELYLLCLELINDEPDHPDFSSYMTSGSVIHESPISVEDLYHMLETPPALVKFLNNYEHQGHFNEPGLEGLTKGFGGLVLKEPTAIAECFDDLLSLKPHYLHEIYSAFATLWEKKDQEKEINWQGFWPKILSFSNRLFGEDDFWRYPEESPNGAFIGNRHWVVGDIARLIEAGCKNNEFAFGLDNVPLAKSTIEIILNHQEGEEFEPDSDAVSIAINSPRGRCIEAYINLALYHMRNTSEEDKSEVADSYLGLFESELAKDEASESQYEFVTLFANYFRNFLYLTKDWSLSIIPKIFDNENRLRWLCAIQGFSYVNYPISEIYNHLKENGDFVAILDSEELQDRVDNRYINFITIAYFNNIESFQNDDSLISLLLKRNIAREINHLIWFIWTLRNPDNLQRVKEMVYELFPRILDLIELESKDGKNTASQLCLWTVFLDDLDEERKLWVLQIASYAEVGHNSTYVMEALAKLSAQYPQDSFDIWRSMLAQYMYDYPPEEIKTILKNMVASGQRGLRNAKEIVGLYLKYGLVRPKELLIEVEREADNA